MRTTHSESITTFIEPRELPSFSGRPKTTPKKRRFDLLLVDDDPEQLLLFRLFLERAGYRVRVATSVEAALHLLETTSLDCVISDLLMPWIGGDVLLQRIRNDWRFADLPVIVLTSGKPELEFDALQSGADMFCEKRRAEQFLIPQIQLLLS
ncbi:MAG: response regulator [Bdellovibrionales bacterium]|nr:response regulator [Bdellovibrionales bacterium]